MDPNKQSIERVRDIFTGAREIPAGNDREQFLTDACGKDAQLRKEVEGLLKADETTRGFLNHDASGAPLFDFPDLIGTTIGSYHLAEKLGEGGFGEVYRAEQTEPLKRDVALKIIKLGMNTKEVISRFEAERQALARMNHVSIAQVYDAGITDTGRPYFVMELVRGIPLITYCDHHRLSLPDRLQLFRQVCEAVQHAHQKGILHRDLKPSNILVTEENGAPLPKVIDFGVAKSVEGRLTDRTLATLQEMLLGTPLYMSPEQLDRESTDLDTRTDIYSLGIILYELIAGATPLEGQMPRPATIEEMRRTLHEVEMSSPSRKLRTLGDKTTLIASDRQIKPPMLERLLRGDLDWIVMKAIEIERDRRYDDVGALAIDLDHYLRHEPVSAGPPDMGYKCKKFVRRHRMGVTLTTTAAMALFVGLSVAIIGFMKAKQERDRAVRVEKEQHEILGSLVDRQLDVPEMIPLLEEGARIAEERLGSDSEAYSWFLQKLAHGYGRVGNWSRALERYQMLMEHKTVGDWQWWSAHAAALGAGKIDLSRELAEGMMARFGDDPDPWICHRAAYVLMLSSDHPSDIDRATQVANQALQKDPHNVWFQITKAMALFRAGKYKETETLLEPARTDSNPGARRAASYFSAMARQYMGETESAKALLKETNEDFARFLRAGDLGDYWQTPTQNLFIRAEAERLILAKEVSEPVTADSLAAAYQTRKEVAMLLSDGYSFAQECKWKESAKAYAEVLRHPALEWSLDTKGDSNRGTQMAVAFVKVGDSANHERLCRYLLAHQENPSEWGIQGLVYILFFNGHSLPADLQQQGIELARSLRWRPRTALSSHWRAYTVGIAEYRAGNYERAIELLQKTKKARDNWGGEITCRGGGMVFQAMALKQLDRGTEARELLAQAREILAGPIRHRSGAPWFDLDICEMALEEATQLIDGPENP